MDSRVTRNQEQATVPFVNILLVDAGTLDRSTIDTHIRSHYGQDFALEDTNNMSDLGAILESPFRPDVVVLGRLPHGAETADVFERVASTYSAATIILVTGNDRYKSPITSIDTERFTLLPGHELARLPLILKKHQQRQRQLQRALDSFPELSQVDADIYRVIASITADYVYTGWVEPGGKTSVQYRSDALLELTGYSNDEIDRGGTEMLMHPEDFDILHARRDALRRGETRIDEFRIVTRTGRVLWIRDHARPIKVDDPDGRWLVVGAAQDITNEKLLHSRLALQASIFELIARGEEQSEVLHSLGAIVEEQIPDAMCAIQLLERDSDVLRQIVNSSLPPGLVESVQEIPVGSQYGACGSAAYNQELTIVADVSVDCRFDLYRTLAERHGIGSVWSTPIFDSDGEVFGTFALYFHAPRLPLDHEIEILESAAQIAGITLEVNVRDAQRQLAQTRYQALVEQTPAITLMADASDPLYLTYLSPQFEKSSEVQASRILRNPDRVWQFIHPDDRRAVERAVRISRETGSPLRIEFRIQRLTGDVSWLQASLTLIRDQMGNPLHWLGVMLDVTDRNEAIRQMTESDRRYRSLFDENLNSIVIYNYEGAVVDVNPAAERISGYRKDEVTGGPLLWIIAPEDRERAERYFLESRAGISCQFPITLISKQGERVELSVSQSPVVVDGEIVGVSSIAEDVTEQRHLEAQLLHQAYHDQLTNLPNRTCFDQMLTNAIETLDRNSELVILFLDLNNFKVINDSLGHDVGDKYLVEIARLLREVVPEDAVVARFGGDEFTVLLPGMPEALRRAVELSHEIMQALHTQVTIDGYQLGTNVSIGIASTTRGSACHPRELIRRADIALYDAKQDGRESNYRIFDEGMDEWVFERLWVEGDLRQALANEEFVIHYQPLIDIGLGEVGVVEALVRWDHPERGLLYPDRFLRIAEETGHILEIDQWVMRSACKQVAEWNAANPDSPPIYAGVNMSARAFWHVGLVERVMAVLDETNLDPGLLCIEITESTLMRDSEQATQVVQELRDKGVLIAVDDFGTGYSSLSYLRSFPIDVLKIDRTFIHDLEDDEQQVQLVQAIVSMAQALGLEVVAEGIESERQYELASELGCKLAQGFHISRPKPFEEIISLIDRLLSTPR